MVTTSPQGGRQPRLELQAPSRRSVVTAVGTCAVLWLLVRTAWMSDDAYITLRTVDNFVNGFGLRWNVVERVQAFTHPAWLMVLTPIYALTREAYFTTLALQIVLTLFTVILVFGVAARTAAWALLASGIFVSSKALIDFSTSGLENPLTHLLLVPLVLEWRRRALSGPLWRLGLLSAGLLLCRLDLALLVAPFWVLAIRPMRFARIVSATLGHLPFVAWEGFSFIYFGQLVPNTALAKLPPGVPWQDLIAQGSNYLVGTLPLDPVTPLVLIAAMITLVWRSDRLSGATVVAIALYVGYVVAIGGDFMVGRFLTAPLMLAVVVMVSGAPQRSTGLVLAATTTVVFGGLFLPGAPLLSGSEFGRSEPKAGSIEVTVMGGVADERAVYYSTLGLLPVLTGDAVPANHPWASAGRELRGRGHEVLAAKSIGMIGFWAGPDADIIDLLALSEPFLARLPPRPGWRIGHFERDLPQGYLESRRHHADLLTDPALRRLYDQVWWITQADIWSVKRFQIILAQYWQ